MRKTVLLLCFAPLAVVASLACASEPVPVRVDGALAQQCLDLAGIKSESARVSAVMQRLSGLERENIVHLAALVRKERSVEATGTETVLPQSDLPLAWLLHFLDAQAETLAFDLAVDGRFLSPLEPGRCYVFQTFDKQEKVVHINKSTLGYENLMNSLQAYSRLYLRRLPGSPDYYAAVWQGLSKHRQSPPSPNPEGHYVPNLMNQLSRVTF